MLMKAIDALKSIECVPIHVCIRFASVKIVYSYGNSEYHLSHLTFVEDFIRTDMRNVI